MDEVTFTDEGAKRVAELLNIAPSGACLYVGYGLGADGAGLGYVSEHGGCGLYIYSGGTGVGATLSIDRPLTDAELEAVLEAGGFKPVDDRTYEEGYADGLADGSQPSIKLGFDAGLEEGFDKGINLASRVARIAPGMHPAFAIKAARKARLAYWESLGQPRSSEPKEASLLAWVAAVSAAVAV